MRLRSEPVLSILVNSCEDGIRVGCDLRTGGVCGVGAVLHVSLSAIGRMDGAYLKQLGSILMYIFVRLDIFSQNSRSHSRVGGWCSPGDAKM